MYDFDKFADQDGDEHFLLVMELVEGGESLAKFVGEALSWQEASTLARQMAEGLAAADEQGVIHRDIKPANVMLTAKGQAKLCDFGLARAIDSTAMTMEGALMGTPLYMAPEAWSGESVDGRADIYSLGITWYQLLTGQPPLQVTT